MVKIIKTFLIALLLVGSWNLIQYQNQNNYAFADSVYDSTTDSAVTVTTGSAVTTTTPPAFTINYTGKYVANEDGLEHIWKNGKLVTNDTIVYYSSILYADSNGFPYDGWNNNRKYSRYSYVNSQNGFSYLIDGSGFCNKGWAVCMKTGSAYDETKDLYQNFDYYYCDYTTGIILKNVVVDGYTLDSDGKIIGVPLTSDTYYSFEFKDGRKATTITPIS